MRSLNFKKLACPFLIVVIFGCSLSVAAQTKRSTSKQDSKSGSYEQPIVKAMGVQFYIETFFKKYKANPDSAIDYIFGTNQLFARNALQINVLKMKMDSLQLSLGKYTGRELISEKSASPSLVVYSYLVKHENQPVRFTFIFYKAQNEWTLYRFNYDDAMDQELFEAVKINNKR